MQTSRIHTTSLEKHVLIACVGGMVLSSLSWLKLEGENGYDKTETGGV